jgi:hypothetical protein
MLARVTSTGRLLSFGGGHYITMADSLILATAAERRRTHLCSCRSANPAISKRE